MKNCFLLFLILSLAQALSAQTLPQSRTVDWTLAGLRSDTLTNLPTFDMSTLGAVGDGQTPNDNVIGGFLATYFGPGAILYFPSGNYLFNSTITLPDNYIIRGAGADSTLFTMDLGGAGHSINILGNISTDTSTVIQTVAKDSNCITLWDASPFVANDWIRLRQYDTDWVTSSWAEGTVGQIIQIDSIAGNKVWLKSPLRMDYDTARTPYIQKINPKKNIGIECLKIKRIDDAAPSQTCNVHLRYAVNCWVTGIESENCTFAHIKAEYASNIYIARSYLHHGFDYGGGGRAYGVVFQFATGECLAEDNIFEHLRHSMLLQAGSNGNVFAYNYSFDPFWSSSPSDAAGDMVLHGNYVYANLFEQNICRNIVIDDSHGPNGPHNTFLRNRAEGWGIFFSANNSPNQNILGNDVTNNNFPYSFANFTIQGSGHFLHGNNNKGTIQPTGTNALPDLSYAYANPPAFVPLGQYGKIGTPNPVNATSIPAKDRFTNNIIFSTSCNTILTSVKQLAQKDPIQLYPNPTVGLFNIESEKKIDFIYICNELGEVVQETAVQAQFKTINLLDLAPAMYFVKIYFEDGSNAIQKIIKNNQ